MTLVGLINMMHCTIGCEVLHLFLPSDCDMQYCIDRVLNFEMEHQTLCSNLMTSDEANLVKSTDSSPSLVATP